MSVANSDTQDYAKTKLTGDWGKKRTELAKDGIDIELDYTLDLISNVSGGIRTGSQFVDEIDFYVFLDGSKLWNIEGSKGKIYVYRNNFGHPNQKYVGTSQGIDHNEATYDFTQVDEAWLSQNLVNDKLNLLAGLYDFSYEFYVTDSSGVFINPSFGVGSELSTTNSDDPNYYSSNSLATRIKIIPSDNLYAQLAIMNAIPNTANVEKSQHYNFHPNAGAFLIAEAGITPANNRLSIGTWKYTKKFPDTLNPSVKQESYGIYTMIEKQITTVPGKPNNGIIAFLRAGKTDANTSQFSYAWTGGFSYKGIFPSREKGTLAIGWLQAFNSPKFRQSQQNLGINIPRSEYGVEITYQDFLKPWMSLQPDIQYIFNPCGAVGAKNALILGIRTEINF
jgi:porin